MALVDLELRLRDGIIDAVMDIKRGKVLVLHAAPSDIRLVRQNQSRRNPADRNARTLVMIADRADNLRDILRRNLHAAQNFECHHGTGLAVIFPVHNIADIVQPRSGQREINCMVGVAQLFENLRSSVGNNLDMCLRVLCETKRFHGDVLLADVNLDIRIMSDFVK